MSIDESQTSVPAAGSPSVVANRRIDPAHRATVLIRLPNVAQGTSGGRTIAALRQALGGLLAVFKRLTQREASSTEEADSTIHAEAQENRNMVQLFVKILVGARRFGPLLQPLAAARRIPIPVIVAAVVSTALILHMTLAFNEAQPEVSKSEEADAPRWDDSQTPPPAMAVAPANTDGSTPAPTNPLAAEGNAPNAWSNQPADLGRQAEDQPIGPPIPGVARLKGRIESVSPTVDAPRYERYR